MPNLFGVLRVVVLESAASSHPATVCAAPGYNRCGFLWSVLRHGPPTSETMVRSRVMLYGLWLIILGALAVPTIPAKPGAGSQPDKVAPYRGWIGAISALWGLWRLVWSLLNIGPMGNAFLWWVTVTATNALVLVLGLLLGVGTLKTFIKSGEAQAEA